MAGQHGGKRAKAGRPPGSISPYAKESKDLLDRNRVLILQKAISMATATRNPNIPLLLKLLDKILPTLTAAEFEGMIKSDNRVKIIRDDIN